MSSGAVGRLAEFTAEQWGMVTAVQARAVGVSRSEISRLLAVGALEIVPGAARVYRLAGSPPDPERDDIRAVWLQLGDARPSSQRLRAADAVVAGRSAALMLGLGDLRAPVHELYVTRRRQLRRRDVRLRVRRDFPRSDWTVVDGLPLVTVSRLVADLLAEREDGSAVARICQDAVSSGRLDAEALQAVVARHAHAYGATSAKGFVEMLLGPSAAGELGTRGAER